MITYMTIITKVLKKTYVGVYIPMCIIAIVVIDLVTYKYLHR